MSNHKSHPDQKIVKEFIWVGDFVATQQTNIQAKLATGVVDGWWVKFVFALRWFMVNFSICQKNPWPSLILITTLSTGGVTGIVMMETWVTGHSQRSLCVGDIPASPPSSLRHIIHSLMSKCKTEMCVCFSVVVKQNQEITFHGNIDESDRINISYISPRHMDHLIMSSSRPSMIVKNKRSGHGITSVIVSR